MVRLRSRLKFSLRILCINTIGSGRYNKKITTQRRNNMTAKKTLKALGRKKYLAAAIPLIMAAQAQGIEFYAGGVEANLDSEISIGQSWRTRDPSAAGLSDVNEDDGNIRYADGDTISQIFKGSHDLQVTYENYGAFVRGKYWYDAELENDDALDDSNNHALAKYSGAEVLDAFVYADFEVMDMPIDVRLGKQVISWGESTFFTGGISSTNPYDVSAFRRPGAELKEGLIPVNMAFGSIGITENFSVEAFYMLEFRETVTPACDTFFSSNDYQAEGCANVNLGEKGAILRDDDAIVKPDSDGQFGLAFRYFSEALDTDFGFYAMNVHSNLPIVTGTKSVLNEASLLDPTTVEGAVFAGTATALGLSGNELAAFLAINGDAIGLADEVNDLTSGAVVASPMVPGTFFTEYVEDTQIYGLSFATNVATMAISGEVSHKRGIPLQINSDQIITAGLVADIYLQGYGSVEALTEFDQLLGDMAAIEDGGFSHSWREFDVSQVQITAIKLWDQVMGASRIAFVGEAGFTYVHDLDESDDAIKFRGGVVDTSVAYEDYVYENTTTANSWGYTTRLVAQYNDVFAGVNVTPVLSYSQDVEGFSPAPGANFREGNETLGFSVNAEYQDTYTAELSYKTKSGTGTSSDRDFAAMTIGMSF